jgi:tetratricopeptide (TPR) repeat protein
MATGASSSSGAPAATSANLDVQKLSTGEKLKFLRDHIVRPTRHPAAVLLCATHVLSRGSLSDMERAAITEQAILAALDCGHDDQAQDLLRRLTRQFGRTSIRVRRLHGMTLEAAGKADAAMEVYRSVLKDSPTEQYCARRLCAIHRGKGNYKQAIEALKSRPVYIDAKDKNKEYTYAELYPMDEAAVRELISLNWLMSNVSECIRYADEVVLFDPANFLHHTRLAQFCAVAGQLERSATAYAQSLRLNAAKNNARAMYGLWHVASQLVLSTKGGGKQHSAAGGESKVARDAAALLEFAAAKLREVYAGHATSSYLDLTLKLD